MLCSARLVRLTMSRPSSNMAAFRELFTKSKHVVVLTGAGVGQTIDIRCNIYQVYESHIPILALPHIGECVLHVPSHK